MKYVVFAKNSVLFDMDTRKPYPYNTYHVRESEQLWKVIKYSLDKKSDKLVFIVTCPKRFKKYAIECRKWIAEAGDVRKIIL